jgi:uncharacterized protein (TIGR03437 family)
MGRTSPAVDDGEPGPSDEIAQPIIQPDVTLGGIPLTVSQAGLSSDQVGVYTIVADVPGKVPTGLEIPLVVNQGGFSTTLKVRVVN